MNVDEAKERMQELIQTCNHGIEEHGEYDDLFQKDKEAIETVLNALDNSVSKDKLLKTIDFSVQATDTNDNYSVGMCNGMLYIKSVILDKDIEYKKCPNNSISKDKIIEKLDYYTMSLKDDDFADDEDYNKMKYGKQVLKDLLEEE